MRTSKTLELVVGAFVALGLAAFFMLALKVSDITRLSSGPSYTVTADFQNIGGLKVGSPVTLAGVRIGQVGDINIDQQTYEAVVKLTIEARYNRLPVDTSASILTSGLLGEQYVGLEPGGAQEYLKDGSKITLTQSALVMEKLVGQLLTTGKAGSDDKSKPDDKPK
jgi:phospholipid/cholesterol/gamma-HCH transport system substrate-binding protein